jgi:UDP-2,3-diacylglucosamine hydrolase
VSDLVFVADVHLVEGDDETAVFQGFLRSLVGNTSTCIIVGDLFNVWIAKRRFMGPGQRALMELLAEISDRGLCFKYVEGNRDYFVRENWAGKPFQTVVEDRLTEQIGPARLLVTHGDVVNDRDWQYRAWRTSSRSWPVRRLLSLLPSAAGRRLADGLERRLRGTNIRHKSTWPEEQVRRHAREAFGRGYTGLILGHFHREIRMPLDRGTIWVLPDWRAGRRYLRFSPDGDGRFVGY